MTKKYGRIITITGVSGSGKTTLADYMVSEYGFHKPVGWTTRKQRTDYELDDYVFCRKEVFADKLIHGDFIEHTYYDNNFYGFTRGIDFSKDTVMILEPVGLIQLRKYFALNNIPYKSILLTIDSDCQEYRLSVKRRMSVNEVRERRKDFLYFSDIRVEMEINGQLSTEKIASRIIDSL